MFHSFQLSTFDQEDSIVIELEDGLDLQDLDGDGKSILNIPDVDSSESDTTKGNFNDFVSSNYVISFRHLSSHYTRNNASDHRATAQTDTVLSETAKMKLLHLKCFLAFHS